MLTWPQGCNTYEQPEKTCASFSVILACHYTVINFTDDRNLSVDLIYKNRVHITSMSSKQKFN